MTWLARPHMPRGGTCTSASRLRQANANAAESRSGKRSANAALSCGCVRGSCRYCRAHANGSSSSTSRSSGAKSRWFRSSCSRTGWQSGQIARQSGPVSKWIVPRSAAERTTRRSSKSASSWSVSNPSSRAQSATCGLVGTCACRPTRCSIAESGSSDDRARSSWRASVARFNARSLSTSTAGERRRKACWARPTRRLGWFASNRL